jgi:activating signal cointegrator complex subunit 3
LEVVPSFVWKDSVHGSSVKWHVWVEDSERDHIYHTEQWILTKKMMREQSHRLVFTIPIFEPLPTQYYVRYDPALFEKRLNER